MTAASASRSGAATRPYPSDRAALVLGVGGPELGGRDFDVEDRHIDGIACGRVALLVTFVDPVAYAPEHLASVRADTARFAREARLLEDAVERASVDGSVVPAKLLTVYGDAAALEFAARGNASRWSRSLARLRGKRECVVHVYAGPHTPPGGEPFIARVSARASRSGRAPALRGDARVVKHAAELFRACSESAISTRRIGAGTPRGALWTASFLLGEDDVPAFELLVERSTERGSPLGVSAHFEGPRLPYSFV